MTITTARSTHDAPSANFAGRWDGLLCALIVLIAIAAARAWAEVGLNDDFSYVRTALVFADTGHFHYFGWSAVPLILQTVIAWPFIKVLGPTYFACRMSTLVLLLSSVVVLQAVLRRCGVNRAYAIFGSLIYGLTPIVLALGVTFMSDICGMFLTLFGFYCALRLRDARTLPAATVWLLAGLVTSCAGGTERQTIFLVGLVLLPCAAWISRWRRPLFLASLVCAGLNLVVAVWLMHWYARQPLSQNPPAIGGSFNGAAFRQLLHIAVGALGAMSILLFPLTPQAIRGFKRFRTATWIAAACLILMLLALSLGFNRSYDTGGLFPFLWGVSSFLFHDGSFVRRRVLQALSLLLLTALAFFLVALWKDRFASEAIPAEAPSLRQLALLFGPFLFSYLGLLTLRAMWTPLFDRYLLPVLVIALIFLLRRSQASLAPTIQSLSWAALAVMALVGVVKTHDWLAQMRARQQALAILTSHGVPRSVVLSGFELDGETEIMEHGSMANINTPVGAMPPGWNRVTPCDNPDPYLGDIHPQFLVVPNLDACATPSSFGTVQYRTWDLPHTHTLLIEQSRSVQQ